MTNKKVFFRLRKLLLSFCIHRFQLTVSSLYVRKCSKVFRDICNYPGYSPYLSFTEIPVLWTVDLPVFQEHAVALAGTHEVVVTGAGGEAAAHSGPGLFTPLTVLNKK